MKILFKIEGSLFIQVAQKILKAIESIIYSYFINKLDMESSCWIELEVLLISIKYVKWIEFILW